MFGHKQAIDDGPIYPMQRHYWTFNIRPKNISKVFHGHKSTLTLNVKEMKGLFVLFFFKVLDVSIWFVIV
jgi:hypothetical protein